MISVPKVVKDIGKKAIIGVTLIGIAYSVVGFYYTKMVGQPSSSCSIGFNKQQLNIEIGHPYKP
jgi:hypothetical protein